MFFEHPGHPWPLHSDRCIPYLIRTLQIEGFGAADILNIVTRAAERLGQTVPHDLARRLEADTYAENRRETIFEVEPDSDGFSMRGTIVLADAVNFFKRLGYPENQVSRGLLGNLVREAFLEVRIRGAPDPEYGIVPEVVAYVSKKSYDHLALGVGKKCSVKLAAHRLPNAKTVWVVGSLNRTATV